MYFIAKGNCVVKVRSVYGHRYEDAVVKTLYPGNHFGEISLIYHCARTATVTAQNYCTLARLTKDKY